MPKRDHNLNLPGFSITKIVGYNPLVIEASYRRKARCPYVHLAPEHKALAVEKLVTA